MIRIAIADDNPFLIRSAQEKLAFFDDLALRFTALNGVELLEKLSANPHVDLILMDIEMPKMNGVEATWHVKQKYPHIKVIMLTVFDNDENIFKSIKAGADGYLLKEVKPRELQQGILDTMNGGATMTPSIALRTLKLLRHPIELQTPEVAIDVRLTTRETEVLEQLSKGLKYEAIAVNLFVSAGTVRKHVENIYAKLQVHNKLEAIEKARNNKLI